MSFSISRDWRKIIVLLALLTSSCDHANFGLFNATDEPLNVTIETVSHKFECLIPPHATYYLRTNSVLNIDAIHQITFSENNLKIIFDRPEIIRTQRRLRKIQGGIWEFRNKKFEPIDHAEWLKENKGSILE